MFCLDQIERDEAVGADAEIGRAARQQLRHIHVRAALADLHVQAALGIKALGQRFIEAAMLGLRLPVGDKGDAGGGAAAGDASAADVAEDRKARRRIMPPYSMI